MALQVTDSNRSKKLWLTQLHPRHRSCLTRKCQPPPQLRQSANRLGSMRDGIHGRQTREFSSPKAVKSPRRMRLPLDLFSVYPVQSTCEHATCVKSLFWPTQLILIRFAATDHVATHFSGGRPCGAVVSASTTSVQNAADILASCGGYGETPFRFLTCKMLGACATRSSGR